MRNVLLSVLVLSVLVALAAASHATTYSVWQGSPTGQATGEDAMAPYPKEPYSFGTVTVSTTATTTAQVVTNLAGRKKVQFFLDYTGTAGTVWVSVGTTTAVAQTGIPLIIPAGPATGTFNPMNGPALELDLDANVALGYVSAAACRVSVLQSGRRQGVR